MDNENRRGHKEALPYCLGGLAALALGLGAEVITSFSYLPIHIITLLGGSFFAWNGLLYRYGSNE